MLLPEADKLWASVSEGTAFLMGPKLGLKTLRKVLKGAQLVVVMAGFRLRTFRCCLKSGNDRRLYKMGREKWVVSNLPAAAATTARYMQSF